jgi:hypothetical protein
MDASNYGHFRKTLVLNSLLIAAVFVLGVLLVAAQLNILIDITDTVTFVTILQCIVTTSGAFAVLVIFAEFIYFLQKSFYFKKHPMHLLPLVRSPEKIFKLPNCLATFKLIMSL